MASRPTRRRVVDPEHPWLGLASFDEETQEWFCGRDHEIRDLFRRVRQHPLTVLFGRSGLGKTSLLGAGLVPKLRVEGYRPVLLRLRLDDAAPPLVDQVHAALDHAVGPANGSRSTLWERFCHLPTRPSDLAAAPPVIVFDQFEEAFTLAAGSRLAEQARLATELADLVENRPPESIRDRLLTDRSSSREYDFGPSPVRVVITLREDYLSLIEAWKKLMPAVMRNRMQLRELDGPQALEAVVKPGRRAGCDLVDDAVGARIVRFVADRPAETPLEEILAVPPLLSLICDELNEARIEAGLPAITADLVDRQSRDILRNFYERAFEAVPDVPLERRDSSVVRMAAEAIHTARDEVRRFVEDRLVTVSGHRTPVAREDAVEALARTGVPDPAAAIDHLVQGRLLTAEERDGLQRLEITHDVLTDLVVRSRDDRRERERARRAEQALAEQRQKTRRQRIVAATLGVLAAASLAAGGIAWWQAWRAIDARELAVRMQQQTTEALRASESLLAQASRNDLAAGQHLLATFGADPGAADLRALSSRVVELHARGDLAAAQETAQQAMQVAEQRFGADAGEIAAFVTNLGLIQAARGDWSQGEAMLRRAAAIQEKVLGPDHPDTATSLTNLALLYRIQGQHAAAEPLLTRALAIREKSLGPSELDTAVSLANLAALYEAQGAHAQAEELQRRADAIRQQHQEDDPPVETVATSVQELPSPIAVALPELEGERAKTMIVERRIGAAPAATERGSPEWQRGIAFLVRSLSLADNREAARIAFREIDAFLLRNGLRMPWGPSIRQEGVTCVRFDSGGLRIATAGTDGTVRFWNPSTGAAAGEPLRAGGQVSALEFSRDGRFLAAGGESGLVWTFDADGKPVAEPLRHDAAVRSLAFASTGSLLAVAAGKQVRLWELPAGIAHGEPVVHEVDVAGVAFAPDGAWFVTLGRDGVLRFWNTETCTPRDEGDLEKLWSLSIRDGFSPASLVVSPDGEALLAAGGGDLGIWRRDAAHRWQWFGSTEAVAAAASPDGLFAIVGGPDTAAHILRLHAEIGDDDDGVMPAVSVPLPAASIAALGGVFSQGAGEDEAWLGRCGPPLMLDEGVTAVDWSPRGDLVATLSADGTLVVWPAAERCPPVAGNAAAQVLSATESAMPPAEAGQVARDWITAVAGVRFSSKGDEEPVPEAWRHDSLRTARPPEPGWSELATWLREQGPDRRAAPFKPDTVRQRARAARLAEDPEAAWRVVEYDPGCPAVRLRLANLVDDPRRAAFLRRFEVDRLPDDATELVIAARWLLAQPGGTVGDGPAAPTCREVALEFVDRAGQLFESSGRPPSDEYLAVRRLVLAENGRWEEAVERLREATRAEGATSETQHDLVWALLAAGHRDDAHNAWLSFAAALEESRKPGELDAIAWTGLLIPALPDGDVERILDWARRAVAKEPDNGSFLESLGAAELRAGDAAAAVTTLEKARAAQGAEVRPWTLLHLAIARATAGDGLAARQILADLVASEDPVELTWQNRLVWRLLRPEAERAAAKVPDGEIVANSIRMENSLGMKLVRIRAGQFTMGSDDGPEDERPAHKVRITRPFLMGQTEVTQAQWEQVMGTAPWAGNDDVGTDADLPAAYVSWDDAVDFCRKLTELERRAGRLPEGLAYRLPTEAEWEYACRAGTPTRFSFGDDDRRLGEFAWFKSNSEPIVMSIERIGPRPRQVGKKIANAWDLFDMHGNAWEWCGDWYDAAYYREFTDNPAIDPLGPPAGTRRVVRGGGASNDPVNCRSAIRHSEPPARRSPVGFRVVCVEK